VGEKSQSMPWEATVWPISRRFSAPNRSSSGISAGNRSSPLPSPCVRLADQKPPLRPDAAQPTVRASSSTTSSDGSRSVASSAVHSPVNPPPTIARSAVTFPASAGSGSGASGWSSQYTRGAAFASDLATGARTAAAPASRRMTYSRNHSFSREQQHYHPSDFRTQPAADVRRAVR